MPRMCRIGAAMFLSATALVAALPAAPAGAAGIERDVPASRPFFRNGNWAEVGLTHVRPRLSGTGGELVIPPELGLAGETGDIFDAYTVLGLSLRGDLTERLSYALIFDRPWGADTAYGPASAVPEQDEFTYDGVTSRIRSRALTTALAYDVTPNAKVWAGLRAQRTEANAQIPFLFDYAIVTDDNWTLGWMAGAGYQIPEIALQVALTYHSRTRHDFTTVETLNDTVTDTVTPVDLPQSVTFDFQSGVAANTLVFGSVRWVEWSDFDIVPPTYAAGFGPLVDFQNDYWTYTLGVGRQLSDRVAGALQATWEPSRGGVLPTLGPVDGRTSVGAGLTWTIGGAEITGAASYGWLGSAQNALGTEFDGGTFTAFALRVGTRF